MKRGCFWSHQCRRKPARQRRISTARRLTRPAARAITRPSGVREDGANPSLPRNCKRRGSGNLSGSHWSKLLWEGRSAPLKRKSGDRPDAYGLTSTSQGGLKGVSNCLFRQAGLLPSHPFSLPRQSLCATVAGSDACHSHPCIPWVECTSAHLRLIWASVRAGPQPQPTAGCREARCESVTAPQL
jgi:hypothetical protein